MFLAFAPVQSPSTHKRPVLPNSLLRTLQSHPPTLGQLRLQPHKDRWGEGLGYSSFWLLSTTSPLLFSLCTHTSSQLAVIKVLLLSDQVCPNSLIPPPVNLEQPAGQEYLPITSTICDQDSVRICSLDVNMNNIDEKLLLYCRCLETFNLQSS